MLKTPFRNAAGKRRTFLVVEEAIDAAANSVGEVIPEWRVFCERWAGASNQFGREYQAAMATQGLTSAVYELPYDSKTSAITSRMRLKIGERVLNITSAFDFEERHEKIVVGVTEPHQSEAA